ncbi:enoyl-CoA hydratase/isomerase family protein [Stutzerimonas kunmingensis]|uniref:enoyl-CoA hydratase/isomerase family protein n=1 Tax=Pseudomonadota TaxID=1224 RepID=UPI0028AEADDD|nr:enoyl-CoA hydratase-related protein [Stutzerimonas kunmingensis]
MTGPVVSIINDGVAELTLSRPKFFNALSIELITELDKKLEACDRDPNVRAVLIRGDGPHFAAGADIQELSAITPEQAEHEDYAGSSRYLNMTAKPTIAAVHGYALGGGCELVEMCDIVIAADDAYFGHPEVTLATMPGAGGTQRLPRLVGMKMAMDLLLSARRLSASEALAAGLVSRVVSREILLDEARSLAKKIADMPANAIASVKAACALTSEVSLQDGLKLERHRFYKTLGEAEFLERTRSFLARRTVR